MSFDTIETSREAGQPIELYKFVLGDSERLPLCYTDAERLIPWDDLTYQATAIQRTSIKSDGSLDNARLTISVPRELEISELFRIYPPSYVVSVFIYQGHYGTVDFPLLWSGRVLNRALEGTVAKLACDPIATGMRRPGLTRNYQYGCPLALYSTGPGMCNAPKTARSVTSIVIAAANKIIVQHASPLGSDDGNFVNGILEWITANGRESRNVFKVTRLSVNTLELAVSGNLHGATTGMDMNLYLGCRHTTDDCKDVHANIVNYGGQPWIPTENPVGKLTTYL